LGVREDLRQTFGSTRIHSLLYEAMLYVVQLFVARDEHEEILSHSVVSNSDAFTKEELEKIYPKLHTRWEEEEKLRQIEKEIAYKEKMEKRMDDLEWQKYKMKELNKQRQELKKEEIDGNKPKLVLPKYNEKNRLGKLKIILDRVVQIGTKFHAIPTSRRASARFPAPRLPVAAGRPGDLEPKRRQYMCPAHTLR